MTPRTEPSLEEVVNLAVKLFNESNGVKLYEWDDGDQFFEYPRAYEAADAVRDALLALGVELPKEPLSGWEEGGIHLDDSWPEAEDLVKHRIPGYDQRFELRKKAAVLYEQLYGR